MTKDANLPVRQTRPPNRESSGDRWLGLCDRYLSVAPKTSIWRYSRPRSRLDPDQGWKLHVSATVLTAGDVLERVGPLLQSHGILFKGPSSLEELHKLNCGVYYGYTQVGKCLTIYPQTTAEALALAEELHDLTAGISAPAVPFDSRFKSGGCVFYRYGAFEHQEITNHDGSHALALRGQDGTLVPDMRTSPGAKPDWVVDPFPKERSSDRVQFSDSPLKTLRVFRALAQRGKGGVYLALDLRAQPPLLCVLKEGRRNGESDWNGRDGYWRVENERKALRALGAVGIDVPRIYTSFEVEGNLYLVTEFIQGVSLQTLLQNRKRRLPILRVLHHGAQLASLLSQLHSAGWVWRDCKPSNLMVTRKRGLRPLDFESACPVSRPHPTNWGTPAFAPPDNAEKFSGRFLKQDDLYALGVTIYYLLSGRFPSTSPVPIEKLRPKVPLEARRIVSGLLDPSPRQRPSAQFVSKEFRALLSAQPV